MLTHKNLKDDEFIPWMHYNFPGTFFKGISKTRINAVCGEGNFNANIILIAQAPGKEVNRN